MNFVVYQSLTSNILNACDLRFNEARTIFIAKLKRKKVEEENRKSPRWASLGLKPHPMADRLEGILPSFNLIGESKSLSMVLWLMIKTTEYDPTASRMRGSDA